MPINVTKCIWKFCKFDVYQLPICDEGKKKGFKLFNGDMPSRKQKIQLVNYSRDWKTLFWGQKLIQKLDTNDARISWNQTMWYDTKGVGPSNSAHVPASQKRDSIQELCPTNVDHFDDANVNSMKNPKDNFLKCLLWLPTIFCHSVFNFWKTTMKMLEVHVQCLHQLQKKNWQS